MKITIKISLLLLLLCLVSAIRSQENIVISQRIPEQEALKQTEKLQQELSLTAEQTRQIYDINLRYARERQISNTRSEALERIKNKNAEFQQILNTAQNNRLQNKRYERNSIDNSTVKINQSINSSGYHASETYRLNPSVRVISNDINIRNSSRSINSQTPTNGLTTQNPQSVRGNSSTSTRTSQINIPPPISHPQSAPPLPRRKPETPNNSTRR